MANSKCDGQLSSQIPRVVGQDRFRRRVMREELSVSGSARRRLWAQLNISNVERVRRLDFDNRSHRRLVAQRPLRRARSEKGCRALTLSRLRRNRTHPRSSGSKVPRLQQLITARATGGRRVERDNQRKHHRHIRNNFGALTPAAPRRKLRSRVLDMNAPPRRSRSRRDGLVSRRFQG
jgi:hypothetical protein